jgi:hypothetical protein
MWLASWGGSFPGQLRYFPRSQFRNFSCYNPNPKQGNCLEFIAAYPCLVPAFSNWPLILALWQSRLRSAIAPILILEAGLPMQALQMKT